MILKEKDLIVMKYRYQKGYTEFLKKRTKELQADMEKMYMMMTPARADLLPSPPYMPINQDESVENDKAFNSILIN